MRVAAGSLIVWLSFSLSMAGGFQYLPGVTYDPAIPALKSVAGYDWGDEITGYEQARRYMDALAASSPNIRLVTYGKTWEGRSLFYAVIGSADRLAGLDAIKQDLQRIAFPENLTPETAQALIKKLPSVVWLAYTVHGNEASGTDAALLTAYHLLAAKNDPLVRLAMENSLVIIDPLQNPDGHERFIEYNRQTRGRWPDERRAAAEHMETWPGGRFNHYLFDMNRDWAALTQPETRARVKAFLEWFPQVVVDLHEMGSDSSYYFAPPAPPMNPALGKSQVDWHLAFGQNNAAWFDKMRFDYFTREVFDSFYPGYGEGWPMFQGAIGMTYEQASTRGLAVKRNDDTLMRYQDAVQRHFVASLSTIETAARRREDLLRHFYEVRKAGVSDPLADVKAYLIDPTRDPWRAAKLIATLMEQGIEVKKAVAPVSVQCDDYYGGGKKRRDFPAGAYVIPLAQPARPLVQTLLSRETLMQQDFVTEQERRLKKGLPDEIYDITAWSMPLLYDVDCYTLDEAPGPAMGDWMKEAPVYPGRVEGGPASLAYLIPWGSNASIRALAALLRDGVRVHSADKKFSQAGKAYPAGTLIVKVKDNPADLSERMERLASETGAQIYATNSGWVDSGVNFGSEVVRYVRKPNVALAYGEPTSASSTGALWFLIEEVYGYPVTLLHARRLANTDLREFETIILPDSWGPGGYQEAFGEEGARRIKEWVNSGGTLLTIGEATRWLTEEKVGLLSTAREFRDKLEKPEGKEDQAPGVQTKDQTPEKTPAKGESKTKPGFDLEKALTPDKPLPPAVPGAILRVSLDTDHWLADGYGSQTNVIVTSRNIFTPLKLDKGTNVALYMPEGSLQLSGFNWAESRKQLAQKAYLMFQNQGRGQVIAFAEDPAFRAMCDGLDLLLFNAILLGPAHARR